MCCSVLQCVAVCGSRCSTWCVGVLCSVVVVCWAVLKCVEVWCSVLQCVAVWCCLLQFVAAAGPLGAALYSHAPGVWVCRSVQIYVAVCCSMLQYVAVCCSFGEVWAALYPHACETLFCTVLQGQSPCCRDNHRVVICTPPFGSKCVLCCIILYIAVMYMCVCESVLCCIILYVATTATHCHTLQHTATHCNTCVVLHHIVYCSETTTVSLSLSVKLLLSPSLSQWNYYCLPLCPVLHYIVYCSDKLMLTATCHCRSHQSRTQCFSRSLSTRVW